MDDGYGRTEAGDARGRLARPASFVPFPRGDIEQSIGARFDRIALLHAERPAVVADGRTVTYRELREAALRVAAGLVTERGADWEPVALLMDHGADAFAALLGILMAGRAYVPLDPADPADRSRLALSHCGARLLLTARRHIDQAALIGESAQVLAVEDLSPSGPARLPHVPPDAPAYVYYTSGSSGRPKGVLDAHRNILHNVMRYTNSLFFCPGDVLSLVQAPTFSGAVSNIFGALLNGAAVMPFNVPQRGVPALADALRGAGVTVYHSVPSLFREVAARGLGRARLRVVRLEGDRSTPRDVDAYREGCPDACVLVNGLGATECGLVSQYFICKDTRLPGSAVPIGYPTADMAVSVTDEAGRPAEPGSIGELAVTSRYLATGYLGDPARTAAAFKEHPDGGGLRTYLTGDLGRALADGCLFHLGRKDSHARVGGRWVDTAEAEAALLADGTLRAAVVTARTGAAGEVRLVAHVVPAGSPPPTVTALRRAAASRLPDHMVPAAYVLMGALPLTPSGKVDVRALPAPGRARPALEVPFTAPRTPLEAEVAAVWSDVLGLESVGVHDAFLDLGGDSLLAVRIASRLLDRFGIELAPADLLLAPTVADMADLLVARIAEVTRAPLKDA